MERDRYAELKKNTVSAKGQLQPGQFVWFGDENYEERSPRILFVGNSITLHGEAPQIGWNHRWGMAASAEEKDYVHLTMAALHKKYPAATYCIAQVAEWERQFPDGEKILPQFSNARLFDPDVIVLRIVENCPIEGVSWDVFKDQLAKLIAYFDPQRRAKVAVTTGFWHHPGNDALAAFARERGLPLSQMDDLCDRNETKALGLFEHEGVANHPGDLGMKIIAERVTSLILRAFG